MAEELSFIDVSNVLSKEKKQQVIALGRLGWPLRRIEKETRVRRETAAGYLKAAGIAIRPPGAWGRSPPAKPANEVSTDSGAVKTSLEPICNQAPLLSPAMRGTKLRSFRKPR